MSLGYTSRSEIVGSYIFEESSHYFPLLLDNFHIPIHIPQGSNISISSAAIVLFLFSFLYIKKKNSYSEGCEVVSHFGLDLYSSNAS